MKTTLLVSLVSVACTSLALAAEADPSAQFQGFPKNLARQHLGTNLLQFNPATHMFTPTQAAAAWLDDDITTGWPLMAEKQFYLLSLAKPELITNFSLSTKAAGGTLSLYASDTAAAPGAASWTPLLKDTPIETINQKLSRDFSKVAKYLLIETSVANPAPVYSLYLYSHKPAVSYEVAKRAQAIEPKAVFGPYVNEATAFNASGLYAHAYVSQAAGTADSDLQKAIDDNPETSITVAAKSQPMTIHYDRARSISRVALLTDPGTKGKVDLFLGDSGSSIDSAPPTMTMVLDGSTPRMSVDFPATSASELKMRWTPANGTDALTLREINSFGDTTLSSYAVNATAGTPAAVADRETTVTRAERRGTDGKDAVDGKDAKDAKQPAIAAFDGNGPYLPGALGFPPNTSVLRNIVPPPTPVLPPETPPASQ